jgi:hypothetical protein
LITWHKNLLIFKKKKNQFKVSNLHNITKFYGTFFHVWKYNIKLVLKSKKILIIVEGLEIELISCLATPGGTIHHLPPFELGNKDEFQQKRYTCINNYCELSRQ